MNALLKYLSFVMDYWTCDTKAEAFDRYKGEVKRKKKPSWADKLFGVKCRCGGCFISDIISYEPFKVVNRCEKCGLTIGSE
jgi:hypothetical protein